MIEQFLNRTSARFYFWLQIKSLQQLNAERPLQCCARAKFHASRRVLNRWGSEMENTWRDERYRHCHSFCSSTPTPAPNCLHLSSLFCSVSLLWFTCFSHSPSSFIRVNLHPLYLPVSLNHFTDYQLSVWSSSFSPLFQIISLLNVFTPQKSLEEFQDV